MVKVAKGCAETVPMKHQKELILKFICQNLRYSVIVGVPFTFSKESVLHNSNSY